MPEVEQTEIPEPDWDVIKREYLTAEGNLLMTAKEYGLSIPDILITAREKGWGERGSREEAKAVASLEAKGETQIDVINGHKATALNLRELVNDSVAQIKGSEYSVKDKVSMIKSLAESTTKISTIERLTHEIDTAASDSPDSIIINMGGKRLEVTCQSPLKEKSDET